MKRTEGTPRILTAAELSLILGISEMTIKKMAREGELPCITGNRRPRFELGAVLEYFRRLEGGAA
jgi:predicted site-specific integrase-resolvase